VAVSGQKYLGTQYGFSKNPAVRATKAGRFFTAGVHFGEICVSGNLLCVSVP